MSAVLALLLAVAAAQSTSDDVRASAACAPAEAEIGQPIECTLDVEHPRGVRVRLEASELALDDSWLMLEAGSVVTVADAANAARAHTRARWMLASLEPGARTIALPAVHYEQGGSAHTLTADPAAVTVRAALGEGEDAPRPTLGFRPPPATGEPPLSLARLGIACALFVAGGGALLFVRMRRRRRPPPAPPPDPLELLARMKEALGRERGDVQAVHYELAALLRSVVDARAEQDLRGLTDEEWLARVGSAPGVSKEAHAELAQLLAECERVKYAQEAPTHWAAGETIDRARALLQRLQGKAEVEAER